MKLYILSYILYIFILSGCFCKTPQPINKYQPLTLLYSNDKNINGQTVKVWGYLDRSNLLLNQKPPRVFIKTNTCNKTSLTAEIRLLKHNTNNYKQIFKDIDFINIDKPIKILLKGKAYIHNKPTNFTNNPGIIIKVFNTQDIKPLYHSKQ